MPGQGFIHGKPWFRNDLPIFGGGVGCGQPCFLTPAFNWEVISKNGTLATVEFTGVANPSPGETIVSWEWDFGDQAMGIGQVVTHEFDATTQTAFDVCLTVTDSAGCVGTVCRVVTIYYDCFQLLGLPDVLPSSTVTVEYNCFCLPGANVFPNTQPPGGNPATWGGPIANGGCPGFPTNDMTDGGVSFDCFGAEGVRVAANAVGGQLTIISAIAVVHISEFNFPGSIDLPYVLDPILHGCGPGSAKVTFSL